MLGENGSEEDLGSDLLRVSVWRDSRFLTYENQIRR